MKPISNCIVVPGWVRDGISLFTLSLLFFSKVDSPFYVITISAVSTVQLNGSGRSEIDMTLPDFAREELDI